MVNFIRWIIGYVDFKFSKGFSQGFINGCFDEKINIKDLKPDGNELKGCCLAVEYKKLHRIAHKNGGVVEITKKHGPIFSLLKIKNRWGLLVGALAFVLVVNVLSGFVWNIEIIGNDVISDDEVISFLENNGLSVGVYWDSVDKDVIENLMMASFDDCAWVHINEIGSTARVEINETVIKPELANDEGVANLVASKDGVIVKATVKNGWAVANVGDGVTQGDLLISGVYESESTKRNVFAHASGEYIARVEEPFELTVSRQQSNKVYGQEKEYKTFNFFGLKIPLYIGKIKSNNCDILQNNEYVKINNKEIPIGITTKTVKPYTVEKYVLTDSELTKLTKEEINKKLLSDFENYEIEKQSIDISLGSDEAVAKGSVICLEDIGKEIVIRNED
jgi:similar to stage IV sporulation protein